MARPVIALLTDFGLHDHYVGVMKGVALGICAEVTFVDISHEIPPQDTLAAALELDAAFRYFPSGTIFLAVVDPGVGSSRRAIAIEAAHHHFVGPDNGIFTSVLQSGPVTKAVELTETRYWRFTVSRTFEGRDRFAPVAAWLATGLPLEKFGPPAASLVSLDIPRPVVREEEIVGQVLRVDHFGNLVTNIDRVQLDTLGERPIVEIVDQIVGGVSETYGAVDEGRLVALLGSGDRLEVAVRGASAAARLVAGRGTPVHVRKGT